MEDVSQSKEVVGACTAGGCDIAVVVVDGDGGVCIFASRQCYRLSKREIAGLKRRRCTSIYNRCTKKK
jgi:hypothetical protein